MTNPFNSSEVETGSTSFTVHFGWNEDKKLFTLDKSSRMYIQNVKLKFAFINFWNYNDEDSITISIKDSWNGFCAEYSKQLALSWPKVQFVDEFGPDGHHEIKARLINSIWGMCSCMKHITINILEAFVYSNASVALNFSVLTAELQNHFLLVHFLYFEQTIVTVRTSKVLDCLTSNISKGHLLFHKIII